MLILRLKRCERALAGGRLDEAVRLLLPADARAHRRGQELMDRLVEALVERAREHLSAGRLEAADVDWRGAVSLAGNTSPIAQIRAAIDRAAAERQRATEDRRRATRAVDALVRQGMFTLAGDVAGSGTNNDPIATGAVVADLAVCRAAVERLAADVDAALARGDWEAAVQRLGAAGSAFGAEARVQQIKRTVAARVADEAGRLVDSGRLDDATSVLHRAAPLGSGFREIESLRLGLAQCQLAWQNVRAARFDEACAVLSRLAAKWPRARWIATASEELRRACDSIEAVRGGTLRMLDAGDATVAWPATAAAQAPLGGAAVGRAKPVFSPVCVPPPASPRPSPRRFLLHVDGAGSFVVLRGSTCVVGPASASTQPDLPLITAAGSPTLTLSRCDDDYFLTGTSPVPVNDRATASKLLATGDRIAVGPRGRIEFRRPNAASGTAVLRVSGARLPWGGVREVLLMDREIVLGASAAAHVRVRESPAPIILQASADGGLLCRAEETIVIDGRACGRSAAVQEGARVVVGAVSFMVCRE